MDPEPEQTPPPEAKRRLTGWVATAVKAVVVLLLVLTVLGLFETLWWVSLLAHLRPHLFVLSVPLLGWFLIILRRILWTRKRCGWCCRAKRNIEPGLQQ